MSINHEEKYVLLTHKKSQLEALISVEQGGRLTALKYAGHDIIKFSSLSEYKDNFASAILFPFANRIETGTYQFRGKILELNCNEKFRNNAIHGLVYDKPFVCNQVANSDHTSLARLSYISDGSLIGFPFKFKLNVTYTLTEHQLSVAVKVNNKDDNPFPFTLGWHPYFFSKDLKNSILDFSSSNKIEMDSNQIALGRKNTTLNVPFRLNSKMFDDAFELNRNDVTFLTPDYKMIMTSSFNKNFLQLYTPPRSSEIAIEPMTGVSDSFNNTIGLQVLEPGGEFKIIWTLRFEFTKEFQFK